MHCWVTDFWVDDHGRMHGQIFGHPNLKDGTWIQGPAVTAVELDGIRVELDAPSPYWVSYHPTYTASNILKDFEK